MKTFKHSGTLGDLIYSLYMVKKMEGGVFNVAIENIENIRVEYGYSIDHVDPEHQGRLRMQDFEMLLPLLKHQSYISDVVAWRSSDTVPDLDLDRFRGVLYRSFEGNILEAYHRTFNMPFNARDYNTPWLEAKVIETKPIVISRSARYRPPNGDQGWRTLLSQIDVSANAIFVGTSGEHQDFVNTFNCPDLEYLSVSDFLELAGVINGAELILCNQGFAYSLAIGLGKSTVLEINKVVPMNMSECYFPRENCQYF